VIAVDELTLRSTQLASSTFDFFSIFFASGLMYLLLTGAIALIQLIAEAALDLDRPAGERFAHLLPWRRTKQGDDAPAAPVRAEGAEGAAGAQAQAAQGGMVAHATAKTGTSAAAEADPLAARAPLRLVGTSRPDRAKRYAELAQRPAAVRVTGLHKRYGKQTVLDRFDMTVQTGEVIALLGPSGSGKSTLLRCINHLEQWDAGQIHVGGRRLGYREDGRPMSQRDLANERASVGVGMVFQQFNLFSHLSARENIAGPLRWVHGVNAIEADRRAFELLERVGLAHRADALPRHLSGGQQQRVAIARALAPNPRVLLLDEPTSALDPELVGEVLEVIQRLAVEDGLTMIISTHQLRFADQVADRVVFMSGGNVVEEGPAHELLTHPQHPLTTRFLNVMGADHRLEAAP
jgi:polar amino acid transport system permease protein